MTDILVIGSLNADLVVRAPRFPQPGETISGEDLLTIPGGKGANQAVAAARLGAQVAMVGRVGSDHFSDFLIENLRINHIETSHIIRDETATGTAIIVVDAKGQNSIVVSPGANAKVNRQDVDSAPDAKIVMLQFEIPLETVFYAAQKYKQKGSTLLLNPAPARPIPEHFFPLIDFLIPNENELAQLTGMPVQDVPSVEAAAKTLLQRGLRQIIITLGANGALIVTNEKTTHIPAFKVNTVDTTAAGDAFIGGFAVSLIQNKPIEEAVRQGCACGALAATRLGAQPSLPSKEEVENFLKVNS